MWLERVIAAEEELNTNVWDIMTMIRQTRRQAVATAAGTTMLGIAGCVDTSSDVEVNAAWMLVGPTDDAGWNEMQNDSRLAVDDEHDWLDTTVTEDVEEADAEQVLRDLVPSNDIIFATSFGFQDAVLDVSEENPETAFEHCSGTQVGDNMGQHYGRMYQGRYLSGVAAGLVTETDIMGFVASYPIVDVIREMNAFAAGVQEVNEDAEVHVRWTNTWYDPSIESEAADALIDIGADVLCQVQDSPETVNSAADAGIWGSGSNAPMEQFGEEHYLTNPFWDWTPIYEDKITAVRDDEWEPEFTWKGMEDGVIRLADFGPEVPENIIDEVQQRQGEIEEGNLGIWKNTPFENEDDDFLYFEMEELLDNFVDPQEA